ATTCVASTWRSRAAKSVACGLALLPKRLRARATRPRAMRCVAAMREAPMTDSGALESSPLRRWSLALLWALALGLLAGWAANTLKVSGDLRLFMPAPRTADQRLLLQQLGEGPGSRLLLVALSGAEPDVLAERSRGLREALADDDNFVFVGNGEDALDSIP